MHRLMRTYKVFKQTLQAQESAANDAYGSTWDSTYVTAIAQIDASTSICEFLNYYFAKACCCRKNWILIN